MQVNDKRAEPELLPELRAGMTLEKNGFRYRLHLAGKKARQNHEIDEPLYRLERVVLGNRCWTREEIQEAGLSIVSDKSQ